MLTSRSIGALVFRPIGDFHRPGTGPDHTLHREEPVAASRGSGIHVSPDDVWVYNNAGLECGAVGEHELALSWLTRALELTVRTGDPERLLGQLRDLRAASLAKLGREPDELQAAVPTLTRTSLLGCGSQVAIREPLNVSDATFGCRT